MEKTLVDVEKVKELLRLLDSVSTKLQDKQLWDLSKGCEQAKLLASEWVFNDEQM